MCSVKEREGALYGEWKFSVAGATEQSQVFWSDQFIVGMYFSDIGLVLCSIFLNNLKCSFSTI